MRKIGLLIPLLILCISSPACSQSPSPEDLQKIAALQTDLKQVRTKIAATIDKNASLAGGLVKALVETRLEILKTTEALVEQRIHALESGAKITVSVAGTEPDEKLANQLREEIDSQLPELNAAKQEAAKYSGGLVGAMKEATVATQEQSIAMLRQRYLAAKYGLPIGLSATATNPESEQGTLSMQSSATSYADREVPDEVRSDIVSVKLLSKRFAEQDYQKFIWLDIEFTANGLDKAARAIKGVLKLQDLFGEAHMKINWTIDKPIEPGQAVIEKGTGFKYNQFSDSHQWVRATDLQNMTASFLVRSILYQDGSRRDF
jgi:hypothetical protein